MKVKCAKMQVTKKTGWVVTNHLPIFSAQKHISLRKLAHAINSDFLALKIENFQQKIFAIFLIFAQNIDYGYTL